jgi:hypothetical protein
VIFNLKGRATAVAIFLFLIAMSCLRLSAQQATLDGQVTDTTGAVVSGAQITVKNVDTGISSAGVSGDDGYYHVGSLTPGNYSVTGEKKDFQKSIQQGVRLNVAQHATVDLQLAPGSVNQTVTVTDEPPQLQLETADRGATVDAERMLTLPTQGRNPIAGVFTVPGVAVTTADQRLRPFDISGTGGFSVNGAPGGTSEVLVDGISSLLPLNGGMSVTYVPSTEAVNQLKVQTTNFDAQYGWSLGGVVNMVTKGGANSFHGAAWEYFQNTVLDANTFNNNHNNAIAGYNKFPRSASHINTFGANFSGPIIKNKLFFEYTYEDLRQVQPDPFQISVPTDLMKQGIFTEISQPIYDPWSSVQDPVTGQWSRTAFQGNVIPQNRLDPAAVKILSMIPKSNLPGPYNNFTNTGNSHKFTDFYPENTARVDWSIDPNTRMYARYSRTALQEERGLRYSTNSAINPADTSTNLPFTRENHNFTSQVTRVLNPTTLLDVSVGFERFKSLNGTQQGAGHGPSTLGFSPTYVSQATNWFPQITWADSNYTGAGATPSWATTSYDYALQSVLSKMIGRYNLKFGTALRLVRSNVTNAGNTAGNFTFNQGWTGDNPLRSDATGSDIASFLLGVPASGYIQYSDEPARQQKMISLFGQNDVRVTERLKLNLGARWDYLGPMTDRFNGLAWFDPEVRNTIPGYAGQLLGGLEFAGQNGNRRGISDQSFGNIAPRVGAAYKLNDKTVLHAGYALMYGQTWYDPGEAPGFSQKTAMVTGSLTQNGVPNTNGIVPDTTNNAFFFDNPFPTFTPAGLRPVGASQGLATALGQSFNFADPQAKIPYTHQYTVEVERELPGDLMVSAAFVGTHGRRLQVNQQLNAPPLNVIAQGINFMNTLVANPYAGLPQFKGTALGGAMISEAQLLSPFPQFGSGGITEQFRPIGSNAYYAGQFLVSKRLSHSVDFTAEYTTAKLIDQNLFANPQDTKLQKVIDGGDIARNMQINVLWQLPFGSGRAYGNSLYGPVRWVISGWDASSLTRLQSGMPLDLTGSTNSVAIGNPKLDHPGLSRWFNTCTVGKPSSCVGNEQPVWQVRQNAAQLVNWPLRLSSVRKPGIHNSDISLEKNSHIGERVNVIFRTDFINAFNSAQFFNGPTTDVNSVNFGKILGTTDQSNLPRFVQFSLKTEF